MSYQEVQDKDREIDAAVDHAIAVTLAMEMLQLLLSIIPGWVWGGWVPPRSVQDTSQADIEGLTLSQIKAWSSAAAASVPPD